MTTSLDIILTPLSRHYADPKTVEVRCNEAGHVIVERRGEGKIALPAPDLTFDELDLMCTALSNMTDSAYSPRNGEKLSCVIPHHKHRFECLLGKSSREGVSLAIRCKHPFEPSWQQIGATAEVVKYLECCVLAGKNIVVSGATNTGKTTFLNKLLTFLDDQVRIIAAEDAPELELDRFMDKVGLIAARDVKNSSGLILWDALLDHINRITPDRVLFGEISNQNALAFINALISGAVGVMCTVHARSPEEALETKFVQNMALSGYSVPDIPVLLRRNVDVVVQLKRDEDGYRRISDVYEPVNDHWVVKDSMVIQKAA